MFISAKRPNDYLDFIMCIVGGSACADHALFRHAYTYDCIVNGVTDVRAVTVPKSAVFIIIPIGSLLLTIQFFRMAWDRFREIKAGR